MNFILLGWPAKCHDELLKQYYMRRLELTTQAGCILWGSRIVVPPKFHKQMLDELHSTHSGIARMKSLGRSYLWWLGLDADIERTVKHCISCKVNSNFPQVAPLHTWEWLLILFCDLSLLLGLLS